MRNPSKIICNLLTGCALFGFACAPQQVQAQRNKQTQPQVQQYIERDDALDDLSFVEMLNSVRLSGDVDFIRKKGTYIKSKGQKAAQHEQKRLRIESLEKARAEKAQQALRETKDRLRRIDGD